jgi:hypothetical protein
MPFIFKDYVFKIFDVKYRNITKNLNTPAANSMGPPIDT